MSESRHTLDELQRWMQAVITHPHGVISGIESSDARDLIAILPAQAERVVTRSRALTAIERLDIYNHAYFGRLLECLKRYQRLINQRTMEAGEPLHDEYSHGADMFRYAAMAVDEMGNADKAKPIAYTRKYRA